jgi:hypothetical protein
MLTGKFTIGDAARFGRLEVAARLRGARWLLRQRVNPHTDVHANYPVRSRHGLVGHNCGACALPELFTLGLRNVLRPVQWLLRNDWRGRCRCRHTALAWFGGSSDCLVGTRLGWLIECRDLGSEIMHKPTRTRGSEGGRALHTHKCRGIPSDRAGAG